MRILMKYMVWLLSLFFLTIYYLLGTTLGHLNISYFAENHYSEKLENKLEILSLNIEKYPFIIAELKINDGALLSLEGKIDKDDMNVSYHLRGERFKWDSYDISEPMDVKGKLDGKFSELFVTGEGEVFEGKTAYSFIRKSSRLEALAITLKDINSTKLVKFLEYDFEVKGDIDLFMDFEYYSSFRKKGLSKIMMKKAIMPQAMEEVEFSLEGEVIYKDLLREFFVDIHSDIGKLRIANGHYNKSASLMKAEYGLHINELSYFEKFLGHKYQGELDTAGNVTYEAKKLSLLGDSTSFGGLLEYEYKNNYLELAFTSVSLEKLLRQLSFPALLSSKIYGTASYDIEDEIILVNTQLKETRFRRTKMTDKIYEVTDIDIRKDVYDNSIFTAGYRDSVLTSLLQIDNGINHLYLKNTRMNSKTNEVRADFEVAIDGQEFVGKIEGTLQDPKVNLDMSKLIKYQINKKIENFFGTGKSSNKKKSKKEVDSIELKVIKYKTRAFLDGFFD